MAGAYLVTLSTSEGGQTLKDGVNALVVWAEGAADAKLIAKAQQIGSSASDAAWAAATATALAATANFEGWRLRVRIIDGVSAGVDIDETVVGAADDFDSLGDLMVIALNANSEIAGAAYATPNLKVAETTDGLGDLTVEVYVYPPASDADFPQDDVSFTNLYGTITHEGSSGDALNVALDATAPVPTLLARLKQ